MRASSSPRSDSLVSVSRYIYRLLRQLKKDLSCVHLIESKKCGLIKAIENKDRKNRSTHSLCLLRDGSTYMIKTLFELTIQSLVVACSCLLIYIYIFS